MSFVAVLRDGRIALVSTRTQEILRYLTQAVPGGGPSDLNVDPSGKMLYFARGDGSCASHLARVGLAGGNEVEVRTPQRNRPESSPAVRPIGGFIAFIRSHCDSAQEEIIIARTDGLKGEHAFRARPSGLAWSPDGRLLVFNDENMLTVVEVNALGGFSRTWHIRDRRTGCVYARAAFRPASGLLAATERCGQRGPQLESRLVVLDPRSGHRGDSLVAPSRGLDIYGASFDRTGRYLLYFMRDYRATPPAFQDPNAFLNWMDLPSRQSTQMGARALYEEVVTDRLLPRPEDLAL